ncbi:hypothetical protein EDM68_00525 [Candidatus Uhrbacteria bacterium]|nr:MAG: hypothetical protein EDM68_00525 [Candidatus Uhrbacteria bacterium]
MFASLLLGAIAGTAAGAILAFVSHVAPRFGAGNFIPEGEHPRLFGRMVSRREAYLVGVFVHLMLSAFFGLAYVSLVEVGWLSGFDLPSMLLYVVGLTIVSGCIVMPLEGHGLFGRKHDPWFMADALITNLLWGLLFLLIVRLWLR